MPKEKYLANIDKILLDVIRRNSKNLGDQNKIAYSKDLEKEGEIKKIAFDVYRVANDPYKDLWNLETIDGREYLVRASDPQPALETQGDWTAISSYDKRDITLAYKKVPIARFSSDSYGFKTEDIFTFKSALLENTKNEGFLRNVLMEQPESKRTALVSEFPEFKKIIKG
jgi:hypothetical protein